MLIRNLTIVAVTLALLSMGFAAGFYFENSSTESGRFLAEEMIKEELVTAALTAENVRKIQNGQIDEVLKLLNDEIDSSIFVADALLNYYADEGTRWFADNMLIRIGDDRDQYPHNSSSIWEGKIDDIIVQARARVSERTRSKREAEPGEGGNSE